MYTDISGIILSGGKSKRMGTDKSFLKIGKQTIIERIANVMKEVFSRVILISNGHNEYKFLGLEIFEDIYKDFGPLAGIHSGLLSSLTEKNFIIACDLPFVGKDVIEFILNYKTEKLITIPKADGFVQLLCGVYSKKIIPQIENMIKAESKTSEAIPQKKLDCNVLQLVKYFDAEVIDIENEYSAYKKETFFNMNRPEDFDFVRIKLFESPLGNRPEAKD